MFAILSSESRRAKLDNTHMLPLLLLSIVPLSIFVFLLFIFARHDFVAPMFHRCLGWLKPFLHHGSFCKSACRLSHSHNCPLQRTRKKEHDTKNAKNDKIFVHAWSPRGRLHAVNDRSPKITSESRMNQTYINIMNDSTAHGVAVVAATSAV